MHGESIKAAVQGDLCTPYINEEAQRELDDCHKQLIERPERKQALRIIDGKDRLSDEICLDSCIFGFKLAIQLARELKAHLEVFRLLSHNRGEVTDVYLASIRA